MSCLQLVMGLLALTPVAFFSSRIILMYLCNLALLILEIPLISSLQVLPFRYGIGKTAMVKFTALRKGMA